MGEIQRQALRSTIINFTGSSLGGLSRILLPLVTRNTTELGLLTALESISSVFIAVLGLGYHQVTLALFPKYRNSEKGHHGFLMLGIIYSVIGSTIAFLIYWYFKDDLLGQKEDQELFNRFYLLVFPMIFFRIVFLNVDSYVRMLYKTIIGVFLETTLSKIVIFGAILLILLSAITFDVFVYVYTLSFCIPGLIILIYAFVHTEQITWPSPELWSKQERKKILDFSFFGMWLGAATSLVIYVDSLMIQKMLSLEKVGIYILMFYAARFVLIPGNSVNRIAQVVLAEAWRENDMKTIREVYSKSCLNLLLIAAYMLGLGWTLMDPVFSFSEKYTVFADHKILFLILGIGIFVEMSTGANAAVIATSKKYRYGTYFMVVLAFLAIVLNYVLIGKFGLIGAAWATTIATTFVNALRFLLLYRAYKLVPFNTTFFKGLVVAILFMVGCYYLDYTLSPVLKIVVNTVTLTAIFWGTVIWLGLSQDVNTWLLKMKKKFF